MTLLSMLAIVLLAATGFYAWFVLRIIRGLGRLGRGNNDAKELVSVVVAARNEEAVIDRCISSVLAQDHTHHLLELIVVDDTSEDATAAYVRVWQERDTRVRLLALPPRDGLVTGRKPEAIALGVSQAKGTIVMTTDADCTHGPRWVSSMLARFTSQTALVAGPVILEESPGLFPAVERLDMLGLILSGAGLIGARRPIICNGANLAYRRSAFLNVRDNVQISSNDDGTLMSRIVMRGVGTVDFALDPGAIVRTEGTGALRAYFRQRMRWASVQGRFLDPTIYAELVCLFIFFASLLAGTIAGFVLSELWLPVGIAWGVKIVVDGIALHRGTRALEISVSPISFLAAQVFHPVGIVLSTLLSVAFTFTWKGRRFRR